MFSSSMQSRTLESSFYYVMLAAACFRLAADTRHPNAGGALRDMDRDHSFAAVK